MALSDEKPNHRIKPLKHHEKTSELEIWSVVNLKTGKCFSRRDFLKAGGNLIAILGMGNVLSSYLVGCDDHHSKNPSNLVIMLKYNPSHAGSISAIAINSTHDRLLSSSWVTSGMTTDDKIWDLATGNLLLNLGYNTGSVLSKWSPDGKHIARAHATLVVCDANNGNIVCTIDDGSVDGPRAMNKYSSLIWNPSSDNRTFAILYKPPTTLDNTLKIYRLSDDFSRFSELSSLAADGISWNPDGNLLAVLQKKSNSSSILLWGMLTGTVTKTLTQFSNVTGFSWTPDGKKLVILTTQDVSKYDLESESVTKEVNFPHTGWVWSPDGSRIASISESGVQIYCINTGSSISIEQSNVKTIAWSHDGARIVVGIGGRISTETDVNFSCDPFARVYSADGTLIFAIGDGIPFELTSVAWIPGKIITAAGPNVFIWDDSSGEYLALLQDRLLENVIKGTECTGINEWLTCSCNSVCSCDTVCDFYVEGCPSHVWTGPCGANPNTCPCQST
jgi:DNA-binding beta-propeller fold protein YncE